MSPPSGVRTTDRRASIGMTTVERLRYESSIGADVEVTLDDPENAVELTRSIRMRQTNRKLVMESGACVNAPSVSAVRRSA